MMYDGVFGGCGGIPDKDEAKVAAAIKAGTMKDSDGDGVPDHIDQDDDNDGECVRCGAVVCSAVYCLLLLFGGVVR